MGFLIPPIVKAINLSGDFTTSATTNTDTALSFIAAPNTIYNIRISGSESKDAGTAGAKMQITAPVGSTIRGAWFRGVTAQGTSLQQELVTAISTLNAGVFGNAATTVFIFRGEFILRVGATGGTVALGVASVTSGTVTVYADTCMVIINSTIV